MDELRLESDRRTAIAALAVLLVPVIWFVRTERALAELRTLRGIIPICSHCKKVRTEVGDWLQIERYVRDRSAAEFSHGICPQCLAAHYAE